MTRDDDEHSDVPSVRPATITEKRLTRGYVRGAAFDLLVERMEGGIWVSTDVAAAYRKMRESAAEDGVKLVLTSGWRSFEEQTALWQERKCTCWSTKTEHDVQCPRRRLGPAAKPGFSNHQSGRAIDIQTGLTSPAFVNGARSKIYSWLEDCAMDYGFKRTVASEPWHWELVPREKGRGAV